jgi:hypothetical protein
VALNSKGKIMTDIDLSMFTYQQASEEAEQIRKAAEAARLQQAAIGLGHLSAEQLAQWQTEAQTEL